MFRLKRSRADKLFSDYIRIRDNWTCQRCFITYEPPTQALHCSHWWGRGNKSVRFNPDNAIALCYGCHRYLGSNPTEHNQFFLKKLGIETYDRINMLARIPMKIDENMICLGLKVLIKELEDKKLPILGKKT